MEANIKLPIIMQAIVSYQLQTADQILKLNALYLTHLNRSEAHRYIRSSRAIISASRTVVSRSPMATWKRKPTIQMSAKVVEAEHLPLA